MHLRNLLTPLDPPSDGEVSQPLATGSAFRLERIVSTGQATPRGEWLVQDRDEWVLLASGAAVLRLGEAAAPLDMRPGDYLRIPAGRRHRVESTAPDGETVWLALHYDPASE